MFRGRKTVAAAPARQASPQVPKLSEFHSILQREGVDGLVMALNRKVDLLRNVAKAS